MESWWSVKESESSLLVVSLKSKFTYQVPACLVPPRAFSSDCRISRLSSSSRARLQTLPSR